MLLATRDRCAVPGEHLKAPTRELVAALSRLVGIRRGADGHLFAALAPAGQFFREYFGQVGLDEDTADEVLGAGEGEVAMGRARNAETARLLART